MAVAPASPGHPADSASTASPASTANPATRLGCGRDVDDVWDSIEQPPNEHEQTCPYCTQARAELAPLSAATRELTDADRQDETLRVPDQLLANVLAIVRTEVRRGRSIPLQHRNAATRVSPVDTGSLHDSAPGVPVAGGARATASAEPADSTSPGNMPELTVSELVIATVVRETCDRNPDVEVRRVVITTTATPAIPTGIPADPTSKAVPEPQPLDVEPADVSMDLQATVSHTAAIPVLLTGLRTAIQDAVTAQIGVTVSRINVDVQDLIDV